MKAVSVDTVPEGRWRLEVKLDGYRAVALLNEGEVELWSRNRKPLTADYPEVIEALRRLRCANATIDGEIVALDAQGRTRFQLLQGRDLGGARPPIVYYVFDLLHRDGRSMLELPIEERQAALEALVGKQAGTVRFSPVFEMKPADLLAAVRQQGLEGIIAKQPGSRYEPGHRSGAWLKCKVLGEQEFVIGGFTPPKNSRPHFGAILVGYYRGREFIYAGKVGSGFDHALLKSLHAEFSRRRIEACPFANLPLDRTSRFGAGMGRAAMREVTWIKPELVAQVRFAEWTQEGLLRQPVFLGLRTDKAPRAVVREAGPAPGM
jgi:bifunctional non-homologous end joining protein LigD